MSQVIPNSPQARDIATVLHSYTNPRRHEEIGPFVVDRAEGVYVYDLDGKRYLESLAGLCCVGLGWGEERLVEAAAAQMRKLAYYHNFVHRSHNPAIDLAERLLRMAPVPMSRVFFANSGSEANDTVVKIVWFYNNARGRPEKRKFISHIKGYHGVTVVAGSLTGQPYVHSGFNLPLPGFFHIATPHHYHGAEPGESEEDFATRLAQALDELIEQEGPETVAAFVAEPVLGSGGIIVPPRTYFAKVQEVLRKHDVLFVVDEVICGFGRTGNMFGCETFDLRPDMLVLAKQLSSAYLPISAVLFNEEIYDGIKVGADDTGVFGMGYTYSGHPVAAAVALETLDIYEERDLVRHAADVGAYMQDRLRPLADHPLVGEVRGIGLMAGVELVHDKATHANFDPALKVGAYCADRALDHGLAARSLGVDSIGLTPPLIITRAQVDEMVDSLSHAIDDTEAWVVREGLRKQAA